MPRKKKLPHPKPLPNPKKGEGPIWFEAPARDVNRISTKLWGLDRSLGGGLPVRTVIELGAYEGVGKSTLGSYLLGLYGPDHPTGRAVICPLEAYDPQYLKSNLAQAGFVGSIHEIPAVDEKGNLLDDEGMIDRLALQMADETVTAGFLDSVGAISPVAEQEGSVREANMGRRARIMGPFMRKIEKILIRRRATPAFLVLANHRHPNLGVPGSTTSGGKAIHFHSATRLSLSTGEKYDDGSRIVEGRPIKLRFRGSAREGELFHVFLRAGTGVHVGLTNLYTAIFLKIADKAERTGVISLNGKSYGRWSALVAEHFDDPERFQPFLEALNEEGNK